MEFGLRNSARAISWLVWPWAIRVRTSHLALGQSHPGAGRRRLVLRQLPARHGLDRVQHLLGGGAEGEEAGDAGGQGASHELGAKIPADGQDPGRGRADQLAEVEHVVMEQREHVVEHDLRLDPVGVAHDRDPFGMATEQTDQALLDDLLRAHHRNGEWSRTHRS